MFCLLFAFRYLMQLSNEYLVMILLRSRWRRVVILNVPKTGINAVSFLPVFLSCVMVFLTTQWLLRHTGCSGFARVFDYDLYRRTQACFVCLFHQPRSHFTKLLTRALFFGPCHCSYIFVPCLAFRVHVTGDLGLWISSEPSPESLQIA